MLTITGEKQEEMTPAAEEQAAAGGGAPEGAAPAMRRATSSTSFVRTFRLPAVRGWRAGQNGVCVHVLGIMGRAACVLAAEC